MTDITVSIDIMAGRVLEYVRETGDFDAGFKFINSAYESAKNIDGAVGIIIDGMEKMWVPADHEGETFLQAAVRKTPLSPVTIRRHLDIKNFLETGQIPDHVRPAIEAADQKSLIRIAKAADTHELSVESWEKIAEAAYSGEKSVSIVIRKITKTEPRSNWLAISIDQRGVLTAHAKVDDEVVHKEMGRLHINNMDPVVQKAIKRIVNCAGITDHVEY